MYMNTDKLTSWLGLAQAIGVAAVTFYTTENADGSIDWTSPMFYVGLGVSVLVAVKAYFTKGTESPVDAPKV
jgi:predicted membrane channel-forming protein YqfA (hemolysin III family)